jgi:hypothetical protein
VNPKIQKVIVLWTAVVCSIGLLLFSYGMELQTEPGWSMGVPRDETLGDVGGWIFVIGLAPVVVLFFVSALFGAGGSSHHGEVQISGKDDSGKDVKVWIRTEK